MNQEEYSPKLYLAFAFACAALCAGGYLYALVCSLGAGNLSFIPFLICPLAVIALAVWCVFTKNKPLLCRLCAAIALCSLLAFCVFLSYDEGLSYSFEGSGALFFLLGCAIVLFALAWLNKKSFAIVDLLLVFLSATALFALFARDSVLFSLLQQVFAGECGLSLSAATYLLIIASSLNLLLGVLRFGDARGYVIDLVRSLVQLVCFLWFFAAAYLAVGEEIVTGGLLLFILVTACNLAPPFLCALALLCDKKG